MVNQGLKFEDARFLMGIRLLESLLQTNQSLRLGVIQAFSDSLFATQRTTESSDGIENKYSRYRALQGAIPTYIRNADA